jgi:hypothetical protein
MFIINDDSRFIDNYFLCRKQKTQRRPRRKNRTKDERHEKAEASDEDNENETENSKNVDVASLPQSVRDYVNTNFGGYTIGSADHDPMCTGEDAIEVVIKKQMQLTTP